MDIMHNKYTFHVSGTHCASCKILLEDILMEKTHSTSSGQVIVNKVQVNLKNQTVDIEIKNDTNSGAEKTQEEILEILNPKIISHKYLLSIEKVIKEKQNSSAIWQAILIGGLFLVLFSTFGSQNPRLQANLLR